MSKDDELIIGGGHRAMALDLSKLVTGPSAKEETKAAIEGICAGALAHMGKLFSELPEGSVDRTLVEVAAATLRRSMSGESIDKMEARIKARLSSQA